MPLCRKPVFSLVLAFTPFHHHAACNSSLFLLSSNAFLLLVFVSIIIGLIIASSSSFHCHEMETVEPRRLRMLTPDKGLTYRYLVLSLTAQQSHVIIKGCYGKLFCQPPRLGWGSRNLNETDLEIDSAICSMMEALSPVDVNLCYSEAFQRPSSPNKKAEKFNIHLSMALLLKVLSKCNTCCQSWIEPWIVREK